MPVKTTGAEFKRFYADPAFWPDGIIHEDEELAVNGVLMDMSNDYMQIDDDARVVISYGVVTTDTVTEREDIASFEGYFRKWRKLQSTATFLVEAPNDKLEAIKAAIKSAGGKVLKA